MRTAVTEINTEYEARMDSILTSNLHVVLEESGSRAVWKEVLAVYSVKVNTDPDNPLEVATMDDEKKELLSEMFWEMNSIDYRAERPKPKSPKGMTDIEISYRVNEKSRIEIVK